MDDIDTLARLFERFPGIGPRQAKRFVYSLLRSDAGYRTELAERIAKISRGVSRCSTCGRFMTAQRGSNCSICADAARNHGQVMILLKDADIESFESAGVYQGTYLILGTLVQLTEDVLSTTLKTVLQKRLAPPQLITEVVLALPVTTDGEHTATLVEQALKELLPPTVSVSTLGRGLSTGSELEYADPQTLRNAFTLRKGGSL
jgi:recombination protein RecR